jgi:prolyl-tRNA editing enzyme YbaK/EbsC (Cys-tRNA(Pro) deacylase)
MPTLDLQPALRHPELLAVPVAAGLAALDPGLASQVQVAPIDATLADTAAFCAAYGVGLDVSANCVVIAGTRGETTRYAACLVLATTRLDVNGVVRKLLDARKASFAPMDDAVALSGMEYGGITPVGIPADWELYLDPRVAALPSAIVGSGIRASKLQLPGAVLVALPRAEIIEGLARWSSERRRFWPSPRRRRRRPSRPSGHLLPASFASRSRISVSSSSSVGAVGDASAGGLRRSLSFLA